MRIQGLIKLLQSLSNNLKNTVLYYNSIICHSLYVTSANTRLHTGQTTSHVFIHITRLHTEIILVRLIFITYVFAEVATDLPLSLLKRERQIPQMEFVCLVICSQGYILSRCYEYNVDCGFGNYCSCFERFSNGFT